MRHNFAIPVSCHIAPPLCPKDYHLLGESLLIKWPHCPTQEPIDRATQNINPTLIGYSFLFSYFEFLTIVIISIQIQQLTDISVWQVHMGLFYFAVVKWICDRLRLFIMTII